jgi:putative nucleotidyltransferase with HDIG domain
LRSLADKEGMEPDYASVRNEPAAKLLPAPGERVRVRCAGFQCLARRDADGTWRSVFGNQVIPHVLEVIPGGDGVAGHPTPRDGIDRLLDQVDRLPPAPRVLPRLLSALSDTETDLNQVVDLVAIDPVLTANLLRACNSAYFGAARPVEGVAEAVHRLGFQAVYRTVAVVSGAYCFKSQESGGLDADQLWRHSVTAAFAAQFIAEDAGLDSGLLFTAGILHDLGKLVLAGVQTGASAMPVAGTVPENEGLNWERAAYGFNHAEVGGRMLERWHFSDQLAASVKYHHDARAGGEAARFAAAVSLADTVTHCLDNMPASSPATSAQVHAALEILGLAEGQLLRYDERIRENLQFFEGICRI